MSENETKKKKEQELVCGCNPKIHEPWVAQAPQIGLTVVQCSNPEHSGRIVALGAIRPKVNPSRIYKP